MAVKKANAIETLFIELTPNNTAGTMHSSAPAGLVPLTTWTSEHVELAVAAAGAAERIGSRVADWFGLASVPESLFVQLEEAL